MENQTDEKIFYSDENVTITNSRFTSNGKTYAMRNISSVAVEKKNKTNGGGWILIIFGLLLFASGVEIAYLGIGLALVGGYLLMETKDEFSVKIQSNAGESDGFVSTDKEYVEKIVNAINEAVIFRG